MDFLIKHIALFDNAAAFSLANKRGVGKIRHLSGKLVWVQDETASGELRVGRVESAWNVSDLGTKPFDSSEAQSIQFLFRCHGCFVR